MRQFELVNAAELSQQAKGPKNVKKGFFQNPNTYIVTPHVNGLVHYKVFRSWDNMTRPMNIKKIGAFDVEGMEVGAAYEALFGDIIENGEPDVPWVLTLETDNIVPPMAHIDLLKAICSCPDCGARVAEDSLSCPEGHKAYDAVGGLYFTKSEVFPTPMAFGSPLSPELEFRPVDVSAAIEAEAVVEVNGLAMGCTLFRVASLKALSRPLFETRRNLTQDIFHCRKGKEELGARYAVHCGVKVGHLDLSTGEIY